MIILRQTDSPSGPGGSIVQSCRGFFMTGIMDASRYWPNPREIPMQEALHTRNILPAIL